MPRPRPGHASREAERVDKLGRDRGVIEGVHLEGRVRGEEGSVEGDVSTDAHAVRDGFGGNEAGRVFPSVPLPSEALEIGGAGGARARVERFRVVVHVVQARGPITGPVTRAEPAADAEIVVVVVPRRRRVERHVAPIVREIVTLDVLSERSLGHGPRRGGDREARRREEYGDAPRGRSHRRAASPRSDRARDARRREISCQPRKAQKCPETASTRQTPTQRPPPVITRRMNADRGHMRTSNVSESRTWPRAGVFARGKRHEVKMQSDAAVGPFVSRPAFAPTTGGPKRVRVAVGESPPPFAERGLMIGAIEANNLSRADLIEGRARLTGASRSTARD